MVLVENNEGRQANDGENFGHRRDSFRIRFSLHGATDTIQRSIGSGQTERRGNRTDESIAKKE